MADIVLNHVDEAQVIDSVGMRNLPWKGIADNPLAPAVIDINWLTAQPQLPFLVNAIPAPLLYRSLLAHGLEDSIEVIEWIRGHKLVQILDYDLWTTTSRLENMDIATDKFLNWLRLWLDVSPAFAAERFLDLDEETIVSVLSKLLDIQPEQMTSLSDLEKDEYYKTPDAAFYIRLRAGESERSEVFEVLHQLIDALYKHNITIAQSCLAHASLLVRSESLEDELRWRAGRLTDVGFVSTEEAFELLKPRPIKALFAEIKAAKEREAQRKPTATSTRFNTDYERSNDVEIDEIVKIIKQLPEDLAREEVLRTLPRSEIQLLTGSSAEPESLQSAILLDDEDVIDAAARSIAQNCQLLLSRFDMAQSRKMPPQLLVEHVMAAIATDDEMQASDLKARVARLANTVASWNSPLQFPDDDLQVRAAILTRGFINLGLEFSLKQSELILDEEVAQAAKSNTEKGMAILSALGAEMIFKIGYSLVCESVTQGAQLIETLAARRGHKLNFARNMAMGRLVEARLWLTKNQRITDPALFHVLNALLNKIPMYPVVLSEKESVLRASPELKPFELLSEIENAEQFFDSLARNELFQEML